MIDAEAIRSALNTSIVGKKIIIYEKVDSTNERAWFEVMRGVEEGTTIMAQEQISGRGRHGRKWHSPRGNIYMSVILRPDIPLQNLPLMTALGAIAVCESVNITTGLSPLIKFPNDVIIDGKKVSGILVESRFIGSSVDVMILGIGVNVNMKTEEMSEDILSTATSLYLCLNKEININILARRLLESIDQWYQHLLNNNIAKFRDTYRDLSAIYKEQIRIRGVEELTGFVEEIDPIEGLFLRLPDGFVKNIKGEFVEFVEIIN